MKQSQQWRPLGNLNVRLHGTLANILNWYCRSYLETPLHPPHWSLHIHLDSQCFFLWSIFALWQKGKCCVNHTMWRNWPQVIIFWGKYKSKFAIFGLKSPARHQTKAGIFFFHYFPLWPGAKLFSSIFLYMISTPLTSQNWKKRKPWFGGAAVYVCIVLYLSSLGFLGFTFGSWWSRNVPLLLTPEVRS
jgi:hypothetical protein